MWSRLHLTPRRALFTPFKVAKGPSVGTPLQSVRFTCGVNAKGETFELFDNWMDQQNAHRQLNEDWIGYTVFVSEDGNHMEAQKKRIIDDLKIDGAWADAE